MAGGAKFMIVLACCAALLHAQTFTWHRAACAPVPAHAAWDSARETTVFFGTNGTLRQWEWDGARLAERLSVLDGAPAPLWLGDDPLRGRLVAVASNHVGTWNGVRWSWQVTPTPSPVHGATRYAFDARRGRVVAYDGASSPGTVYEWDGAVWAGQPVAGPGPRLSATFGFDPVGQRCVLYGGNGGSGPLADCWSWDGSTWLLLATNAPPGPREHAAMAFSPAAGALVLYGGSSATTTWRLAGNGWTQVVTAHDPGPRSGRLVRDAFGLLLVTGDPETEWRFSGSDWSAVASPWSVTPRPRFDGAAACDRVRGRSLHFGGLGVADAGQTFDTRWRNIASANPPAPRTSAQACWSGIEQSVLLFGGRNAQNQLLGDTWNWTGIDWVQRVPVQSPSPRAGAALAEDPNGGVLLFGGSAAAGVSNEHWHWNGSTWSPVTAAVKPPPSAYGRAALDPLRQRTVLLCRLIPASVETWEWDGAAWAFALAGGPQSSLQLPAPIAFDPRRGRIVALYGTTAEWDGVAWLGLAAPWTSGSQFTLVTDTAQARLLATFPVATPITVAHLTDRPAGVVDVATGCAIGPTPRLHSIGQPTVGNPGFALEAATTVASAPVLFALGLGGSSATFGGGCASSVGLLTATFFAVTRQGGNVRLPMGIPNDANLRGWTFHAQALVLDPQQSPIGSITATQTMRITIGD